VKKKILLIDDDAAVIGAIKSRFGGDYDVEVAEDGQTGYYAISERKPAVVLIDATIPQMKASALMGKIRAQKRFETLPFIVLLESFTSEGAEDILNSGGVSVFAKSEPNYLDDVTRELGDLFKPFAARNGRSGMVAPRPETKVISNVARKFDASPSTRNVPVDLAPVSSLVAPESEPVTDDSDQLRQLFAVSFSTRVHAARQAFVVYMTAKDAASRASAFEKFYKSIVSLRAEAAQCELGGLIRLLDPMERRSRELRDNVEGASAATRQVLANAIDFMAAMNHQVSDLPELNGLSPSALVMDDEAVSRRAISLGLEKAQIRVTAVDSGEAAIRECESSRFDVVLLDVEMPGLNGFAVCARIRTMPQHRETPILFISALDDLRSRASSKISGGNQFISKPVNFLELSITTTALLLKQRLKEIDRAVFSSEEKRKSVVLPE